MIYTYDNITEMPDQDYLDDLIHSNIPNHNLIGIDVNYENDIYTITIEFDTELTDEEKTTLDDLVNQCIGHESPIQDTDVILKNIYDNATSQEQSMRFLTTFNTYPVINAFLDNYNYDMAWYYLNQANADGILTDEDITYLQQYIPTGDW